MRSPLTVRSAHLVLGRRSTVGYCRIGDSYFNMEVNFATFEPIKETSFNHNFSADSPSTPNISCVRASRYRFSFRDMWCMPISWMEFSWLFRSEFELRISDGEYFSKFYLIISFREQRFIFLMHKDYYITYLPFYMNSGSFLLGLIGGIIYCENRAGHINLYENKVSNCSFYLTLHRKIYICIFFKL